MACSEPPAQGLLHATCITSPPKGYAQTGEQILRHLRRTQQVPERAMALGHHPFGAILVEADQETV